jgi:hypothetical protein
MKKIEQNLRIVHNGRKYKVQFNFCTECKSFKNCYEDNPFHPSYLSPECLEIGQSLGYDA